MELPWTQRHQLPVPGLAFSHSGHCAVARINPRASGHPRLQNAEGGKSRNDSGRAWQNLVWEVREGRLCASLSPLSGDFLGVCVPASVVLG